VRGAKPLQIAARFNNEYMCKEVLRYLNKETEKVKAFLLRSAAAREASLAGNLEILKLIIGFDSKEKCQQLSLDQIERILENRDKNGYTCLHLAASQGKIVH